MEVFAVKHVYFYIKKHSYDDLINYCIDDLQGWKLAHHTFIS